MPGPSAASPGRFPATPRFQIDRALARLAVRAGDWVHTPIDRKVEYLDSVRRRAIRAAPAMIDEAIAAKGVDERYAGEDWVSGPVTLLRTVRFLADTLGSISRSGRVPLGRDDVWSGPGGRVAVRVMPGDRWDRLLYPGITAQVRLEPGVEPADLPAVTGSFYTKGGFPEPTVAAVLGAGNVASIGPLDVIHKLFVDGSVCVLKHNPVNDYIGPFFEDAFADLIADGFVRSVYGGADVGEYLVRHPEVGSVHITGAAQTHDTIVWGPGDEGEARRAAGTPLLDKPITSELGNVSPVIVVPGPWTRSELQFQAERVATTMMQNDGFNCNATRVVVLHRDWPLHTEFLDRLRAVLASLPPRPAYYPGAEERFDRFARSHAEVELLGERGPGVVPPALLVGVSPEFEHLAFHEEAFCPVAATTVLDGDDAAGFLAAAVAFCNEQLQGTLNVTMLVDPATERTLAADLDEACARLRYGTVGVNIWAAAGFVLGVTPWGGYPGATLADVQSGVGFVHNARLVDRPEKSVFRGPFRPRPKPPWFVTHRSSAEALRRVAEFEADPGPGRFAVLLPAAVRS